MHRRDFLLFRPGRAQATADLSCQQLHMAYIEMQVTASNPQDGGDERDLESHGEPPAVFTGRSVERMFEVLEQDLRRADLLRVLDATWLTPDELRHRVEALVDRFRARGGSVEYATR
ncbi:MAG: hypothetical protein A3H97_14510 [Acidobacteria bacterium RIFCSPLOWO2_02_FULL_65_29]|nr:MAG: hypothetical protein A3H97_14510 [Acidobacteria bacterium RIFCSPLOWO2_02_FULL_65_29]